VSEAFVQQDPNMTSNPVTSSVHIGILLKEVAREMKMLLPSTPDWEDWLQSVPPEAQEGQVKQRVDREDLDKKDAYNPALVVKSFSLPMLCSCCQDKTAFW